MFGHFEGDEQKYKTDQDPNRDRDPIVELRKKAIQRGWMTEKEANDIETAAKETIKDAVEFAEASPLPDLSSLYTDIFA
jgi:acetoin:2,6-dichlorophenolindophenol oxidoreductase subunit alpha